jgi:hypothetical protein
MKKIRKAKKKAPAAKRKQAPQAKKKPVALLAKKKKAAKKPARRPAKKKPLVMAAAPAALVPGPVPAVGFHADDLGGESTQVMVWEDDPVSDGAVPVAVPAPGSLQSRFQMNIIAEAPLPGRYEKGTREFRYWNARAALVRCRDFWEPLLPADAAWQTGGKELPVVLDKGVRLNASYDRLGGLSFFHDTVNGEEIYTADSPDIVCHEMGHAILDAIQPTVALAGMFETAAFHEAFGDISALLTNLQVDSFCDHVLGRHGVLIENDSRWTRIGEALGRAINKRNPDRASPHFLRNAANGFFYQPPTQLPISGIDSVLTREPHSLARTFVGGFLQGFAEMVRVDAALPTRASLQQSALKAGALMVLAIRHAPVQADYFFQLASQLAAQALATDTEASRDAFAGAFVRRGILPVDALSDGWPQQPAQLATSGGILTPPISFGVAGETQAPAIALSGKRFGLKGVDISLSVGVQKQAVSVSTAFHAGMHRSMLEPTQMWESMQSAKLGTLDRAIQNTVHSNPPIEFGVAGAVAAAAVPPPMEPARQLLHEEAFIEYLFQRGRVEFPSDTMKFSAAGPVPASKTHKLVKNDQGQVALERISFDCGFD